jgi:AcrR family transcriptional regulator
MRLYVERGYEQTTVAEIAGEAGLTARTFFRYFADKREVLFAGSEELQRSMVEALDATPPSAAPIQAVAAVLDASAAVLGGNREYSRLRQSVISANPELLERELIKMATLARALAEGLRRRGVAEPDASLAAEAGIVAFRVGFETWIGAAADAELGQVMRESLDRLRTVAAAE